MTPASASNNINTQHPMPINMQSDTLAQAFSWLSIQDLKAAHIACKAFKQVAENNFCHWIANQYSSEFVQKLGGSKKLQELPFAGFLRQGERSTIEAARELYALINRGHPLAVHSLHRICIQNPTTTHSTEALIYRDQVIQKDSVFWDRVLSLPANFGTNPTNPRPGEIDTAVEEKFSYVPALQALAKVYKETIETIHHCLCILEPGSQVVEVNLYRTSAVVNQMYSMHISLSKDEEKQLIQEASTKRPLTILNQHIFFDSFQDFHVLSNLPMMTVWF